MNLPRRVFPYGSVLAVASPRPGSAQRAGKLPRVGYLVSLTLASGRHPWEACRQGLRELGYREFVDEGGLISFGPNRPDLYRRTATYVDKILKGAAPGGLPIERPPKIELVLHPAAARALGTTIPPSLLLRADQVIE